MTGRVSNTAQLGAVNLSQILPQTGEPVSLAASERGLALIRSRWREGASAEERGGESRMLAVLAQHAPSGLREAQWAVLAKLKRSGGTWSTYKSRLRSRGYLNEVGGLYFATEAGVEAAGVVPEMPQTTAEVLEMWRRKPGMGPAIRLVEVVDRPDGIDRDELAAACALTAGAGTFSSYLSRARTAGLLEVQGRIIRPADALFP